MASETVQISATIPVELHKRLAIAAVDASKTRSELIAQAIQEYLDKHKL
jgi:metal-responsive CopG/Arc/MetJ family transcriptional regulator